MRNRIKHPINRNAIYLASGSFVLGSLLLLTSLITKPDMLLVTGLYYTMFAAMVNTIMLIILILNALAYYKDYIENLGVILLVLLNIPIAIYYIELVFRSPF